MSALPVVLVPVGVDDDALDACLAALDAGTPLGTRVWLADDAQAGPRGIVIVERWLARTGLQADYTRRPRAIGEAAHLDDMLKACGDADVLVLASDAVPFPGWANQLVACAARDPAIATATPWCNAGETASWPRVGEVLPVPDEPLRLARAAASLPPHHPELPAAVNHAVFLRGNARRKANGKYSSSRRPIISSTSAARRSPPSTPRRDSPTVRILAISSTCALAPAPTARRTASTSPTARR